MATAGTMWIREVVFKGIIWRVAFGLLALVAYPWAFFDRDRQTFHDKMMNTYVIDHPGSATTLTPVPITLP